MPSSLPPSPHAADNGAPFPDGETWLTSPDLAARWHIPLKTIASWASAGTGPRYSHLGRHHRYRLAAVRLWEIQRLHHTNSGDATDPPPPVTIDESRSG